MKPQHDRVQDDIEELLRIGPKRPKTQSERILRKFGGEVRLLQLLEEIGYPLSKSTIYRWSYPRSRGGCDGVIPAHVWPIIKKVALYDGIILTSEDFEPVDK